MSAKDNWEISNERYLSASLKWLRLRLARLMASVHNEPNKEPNEDLADAEQVMRDAGKHDPAPALEFLGDRLGLSRFERQVLFLCAAMELDTRIASLCARAQDDAHRQYPTLALAMALFDDPAWDVVSPERPLRHWRLIDLHQPPTVPLMASAIKADERIVNYIKGLNYLDDRLTPFVKLADTSDVTSLPRSQQKTAETIVQRIESQIELGSTALPIVQLAGTDPASKRLIAEHVAGEFEFHLYRITGDLLPTEVSDLDTFARLWERESVLLPLVLFVDINDSELAAVHAKIQRLFSGTSNLMFVDTREPLNELGRPDVVFDVAKPSQVEQRNTWQSHLDTKDDETPRLLAGQFDFNTPTIARIANSSPSDEADLWDACRRETRPQLESLSQRIDTKAKWDDIVLPSAESELLRNISAQVHHRGTVYDDWGFREKMNRGLGLSVLFSGPSGTGKTMAAEVIANELRLDLFRIDLSSVVNKYIGETEKNLRRVFDAAEEGGVVLFFDEADALFGKRTEVKDSHDRYANIEVNYLLQRMESYRGLAILATNAKNTLDTAFLRRLRFVVDFPVPSPPERKRIWKKVFPTEVPISGLDYDHLSRLKLTGGNIHNIALNAAFSAAANGGIVTMPHVLSEAKSELRKLQLPINAGDFESRSKR